MAKNKPLLNICTYKVKPGKEAEMERLLAEHWPTLHRAICEQMDFPVFETIDLFR